ncbi:MAG TPA: aminodeoxychorismate/anthranilate synthase component II [Candidatus Thermoplasmatota archaeon]|nr:aminodeoxychorismate/anthranilate synthase component II [Candidatus Thermoplasmatota archaeon]
MIDNYDSFTYNLVQYLAEAGAEVVVHRNDKVTAKQCEALAPDGIVISPGPGNPSDPKYFGVCKDLLLGLSRTTPTLGVCLGLQGFAHVYGGRVVHAPRVMHGKACAIRHDGKGLLRGVPTPFQAGRYHSLVVEERSLPPEIEVSARTESGEVMGARHRTHPIEGVQFHPESILTEHGKVIIRNFLDQCAEKRGGNRP